jgi:hypothetical protein
MLNATGQQHSAEPLDALSLCRNHTVAPVWPARLERHLAITPTSPRRVSVSPLLQ